MARQTQSGKLRVMYLALELDLGGLQRVVNLIIEGLDKDQFTPYICCLDRGGFFLKELKSKQITSFVLSKKPGPLDISSLCKLYQIIRREKIDVIHSQNGCITYAALAGILAGVKAIIHTDHGRLVPDKKSAMVEDRLGSYLIHRYVSVSQELTQYLTSIIKIRASKILTVINGVDTKTFVPLASTDRNRLRQEMGINNGEKLLGTVCRLDPIKNLKFLLSNFATLSESIPDCKLMLVGEGSEKEKLVRYADVLRISSRVIFTGFRPDVERIVPLFDVYTCTSLSEGTSMTILEALSCGVPVIASAVGGNVSIVDASNGRLYQPNDGEALRQHLAELLNDPALRCSLGENGRRKVERDFSFQGVIKKYERLYTELSLGKSP